MNDKTIKLLSTLIAELSVPLSIGILTGSTRKALTDVRDALQLFGYPTADEVEEMLRHHLDINEKDKNG